jgi:hypothetical protein
MNRLALACVLYLSVSGCGSAGEGSTEPTPGAHEYSLKVLVQADGEQRLVRITAPDSAALAPPATAEHFTRARVGGTTQDTSASDAAGALGSGSTLLYWAAYACHKERVGTGAFSLHYGDAVTISVPWKKRSGTTAFSDDPSRFYIFDKASVSRTCDHQLLAEEVLLCAADRLAQIADSVGTVVWNTAAGDLTPITVTIPPQAREDKFIARDMAMNVLAHLSRVAAEIKPDIGQFPGVNSCAVFYGQLLNGVRHERIIDPNASTLFPTVPNDARATIIQRIRYKRKLYTAALRLLKNLIEASVEDDLAGAERARSEAADPGEGARRMWGYQGSDRPADYNSIGHALRVLFGRLERNRPAKSVLRESSGLAILAV